ncbi:MAG: alpha-amylase family glycosyl hydrolase [Ignavibacteriales bacterium]|nr:alpha-amylase family glycosyl hydrolase [Ignavibacteriales bacterium]
MFSSRIKIICLLFFALIQTLSWGQITSDLIEVKKITIGVPDTTLISDLFYSKNYNLKIFENKNVDANYSKSSQKLILNAKNNFTGLTLLDFSLTGKKYSIPILSESPQNGQKPILQKFTYKPAKKVNEVKIFGSFNDWNKNNHPLKEVNGVYEIFIPLLPGSYTYKFIVDGKEIVDPENPQRTPTGFDDFNSVINIGDSKIEKCYLHNNRYEATKNFTKLFFIYERDNQKNKIVKENISALIDNQKVSADNITIEGNTIEVSLPSSFMKGEKIFRIAVTQNDRATNLQTLFLVNGKPADKEKHNSWYDSNIYSIMIDRFNDGDKLNDIPVAHDSLFPQANYMGGDFQGIINKIEDGYFDSLSINVIWISPVYDNPDVAFREFPKPHRWYSGYHGYWPVHHQMVEEKFGTMEKLKELVAKAHNHKIKILLDFVAHHVHIDHPFYKEHPDWFGKLKLPDGRLNLRFWDEYRLTTWFEPYMPSFDFINSSNAINAMTENAVWWLKESGADGFRHDAVKHVPNEFWRALTKRLKEEIGIPENKIVYQIGETFGNHKLVKSYVNNGQLNAQFNFDLSYFAIPVFLEQDKSFTTLDLHMKQCLDVYGVNNLMGNIMDSHDKVRFMAYADGDFKTQGVDSREMAWNNPPQVDHADSYKKAELYLAFMHTIPGLPIIYYGSEFGMTGLDDPDNRRMMKFGVQLSQLEKEMLKITRTITKLRLEHSALRYGDFQTLKADNLIYSYLRADMNEKLIVVLNKDQKEQTTELRIPSVYKSQKLIDVLNNDSIEIKNNTATLVLPAFGWKVYRIEN